MNLRKFLWVSGSARTWACLELICENHKITMHELVGRILEVTSTADETLLEAVLPISKVLNEDEYRREKQLIEQSIERLTRLMEHRSNE
jgi:hypothetical protein